MSMLNPREYARATKRPEVPGIYWQRRGKFIGPTTEQIARELQAIRGGLIVRIGDTTLNAPNVKPPKIYDSGVNVKRKRHWSAERQINALRAKCERERLKNLKNKT